MNAESYGFTFVKNKTENIIVAGIVTPNLIIDVSFDKQSNRQVFNTLAELSLTISQL